MTRLCGLNPQTDYTPVEWALRTGADGARRVRGTVEAECTVTAYEALSSDEQAILVLLDAIVVYALKDHRYTIMWEGEGRPHSLYFRRDWGWTLKEFLGYYMDHGVPRRHE